MKTNVMLGAKRKSRAQGQQGFLMLDFIFALMITFGFACVFFAVTVTLSFVEVAQYITFASSRAYLGAQESPEEQTALGQKKYKEIMGNKVFATIFGQGWVTLDKAGPTFGEAQGYKDNPELDNDIFVGAQLKIDARVLHLRIPFLGSTTGEQGGSGVGKATLNSFLMREVTSRECREDFNAKRYEQIRKLDGAYAGGEGGKAALITDNGC